MVLSTNRRNEAMTIYKTLKDETNSENTPLSFNQPSEPDFSYFQQESFICTNYVDRYLSNLFLQIGVPANKLGYRFLCEAVRMVLKEPALQNRLMHGLYPKLAEHFHTSVYCVEHSMRCAITAAWNRGRPELVEKLLGRGVSTAYEKPTNGELIALVAENLRLLLNENKLK